MKERDILHWRVLYFMWLIPFNILVAGKLKTEELKVKYGEYSNSSEGFTENKGQFIGKSGKPVNDILFKTSSKGVDVYITTHGLIYVFNKFEIKKESFLEKLFKSSKEKIPNKNKIIGPSEKEDEVKITSCWEGMEIVGAKIKRENVIVEFPEDTFYTNYYLSKNSAGILNVKSYKRITIKNVYPGIDWVVSVERTNLSGIKHDFLVNKSADPADIEMRYHGAGKIMENENSIRIVTPFGELTEGNLYCYQGNKENKIAAAYSIKSKDKDGFGMNIKFNLKTYDNSQQLIIDPPIFWATYYGGANVDGPWSISADKWNNIYVGGYTGSVNFPLDSLPGAYYKGSTTLFGVPYGGPSFILKFNSAGVRQWATFFNGSIYAISNDSQGNLYVGGNVSGNNAPYGSIPLKNPGGGAYYQGAPGGSSAVNGYITEFNSSGALVYSTFYGGNSLDVVTSMDFDANDNLFFTGITTSSSFPLKNPGAGVYFQATGATGGVSDAFIVKLDQAHKLIWSTYFGGSKSETGNDIVIDNNRVYISGNTASTDLPVLSPSNPGGFYQNSLGGGNSDVFIARFSTNGTMQWSTYFGGQFDESQNIYGSGVDKDSVGNLYISGTASATNYYANNNTNPINFPFKNPGSCGYFQDTIFSKAAAAFIAKFDSSSVQRWGTFYGSINETGDVVITDKRGNVFLIGTTASGGLPTVNPNDGSYYQPLNGGGVTDMYFAEFTESCALRYATFYGSTSWEFPRCAAVDTNGSLLVIGEWSNFYSPGIVNTVNPGAGAYFQNLLAGEDDGFIMKFSPTVNIPMNVQFSQTNNICNSGSSGRATATVTGGIGPYTYKWSTVPVQTTSTATGLIAGTYTVTIIDGICNLVTAAVIISQPPPLIINVTTVNAAICGQPTGSATANPNGGTPGYTYVWQTVPVQITQTASNIMDGNYNVTVTDANGCTASTNLIVNCGTAVPLTFLNFDASLLKEKVFLEWETASEINNEYFSVQRSEDAKFFYTIAKLMAIGNSAAIKNYNFTDCSLPKANQQNIYYRIQQTDYDKKNTFSEIRTVALSKSFGIVEYAPNPVGRSDFFYVLYKTEKDEDVSFALFNELGVKMKLINFSLTPGINSCNLDLNSYPSGIYFIRVSSNSNTQTIKIILR